MAHIHNKVFAGILAVVLLLSGLPLSSAVAVTESPQSYIVVLAGTQAADGTFSTDTQAALALVESTGGTVTADLSRQIGVLMVDSSNALFADTLRASTLVEEVGQDFNWKQFQTMEEAIQSGNLTILDPESVPDGGPEETADPLESLQWDMQQIRTPQAHATQAGARSVDVGVLDSGIDATHADFVVDGKGSNVDVARGRDFTLVGTQTPATDNQFHGTHVAGTIAAQANGVGMVGVAPNVTLVPVKVCDASGYCYASPVVQGITYAGDAKLDVINMSFFVDDDQLLSSTEFKCASEETQRTFRHAVERAIQYARNQGVTPVAALGNSDTDLANPPTGNECEVVPAETQGVVGTASLGRKSEKARYSNYGTGATDVAAPGGNGTTGDCNTTILSTLPGDLYGCIQGTSMASPHAAGVAALIVSQYGEVGPDGDVHMPPTKVEQYLQATTIDIGLPGYDECYGNGRIDALRAVLHDTSDAYDSTAPYCPEYEE